MARGMFHFARSASGNEITSYHLEAGIAACHCAARDYASTDWRQILMLYDQLIALDPSPVIALNRAVAVAEVHGPAAGIEAVKAIGDQKSLANYYLLPAVLGEFKARLKQYPEAAEHFRKALALVEIKSEQAFLAKRLQDCEEQIRG